MTPTQSGNPAGISSRIQSKTMVDFGIRLYLGYVLVSNAPVGTWIPLSGLGLDERSLGFLNSLWQTSGLMYAVKGLEALAGALLILNRHVGLAALSTVPLWIGILFVTAEYFPGGLWKNASYLILTFILIYFRREDFNYVEHRLHFFRNPTRSHQARTHHP
jgi:hypothetical protein